MAPPLMDDRSLKHECPVCHHKVELDMSKTKARHHRVRRPMGPWCEGGGTPVKDLIEITD